MKKLICILTFAMVCSTSFEAQSAAKPITLKLEDRTTIHVGELAVVQIPKGRYNTPDGWKGSLVLVRKSARSMTFRAIKPGPCLIMFSPDVPDGHCISCATYRYFIDVVPGK